FIAIRAYRKKSLNLSGAVAGFVVMAIHLAANLRYGAMLLAFFFTSSALTKRGAERKREVDAEYKEGGQRNWIQVLSNSVIATILVATIWSLRGWEDSCLDSNESKLITALVGGIIGQYCCCNGDTWSSELGVLSDEQPRMITTFKVVRKGTNGAVTKTGLIAAAEAGAVIGLAYYLSGLLVGVECLFGEAALKQLLIIPLSSLMGLCGSLIDSLLGATVQYSGYCQLRKKVVGKPAPTVKKISGLDILDNNGVNLASILLTTLLTSLIFLALF
ncbi:PGR-like protein, partial [Drosera capensis]